jgi:hypothetical protein
MAPITHPAIRIGCVAAGLALFCAACLFPTIGTCSRNAPPAITWFDNQTVAAFGWLGIFALQIGWFANIPFAANLVALARNRRPGRRRIAVQAVTFLGGSLTLQPVLGLRLWHNEAWSEPICRLGPGFWLWAAAQALVLAAAVTLRRSLARRHDRSA